ncbi:hypothetical protein DJ021_14175 [Phenylobacterium hankyongense]|uniref:Uncharacterized protein n=1 Tax=Phenylobacterium hankyongense TaxID=1813876 RepID=A0A328B4N4_9CAUL|nr:hypothetical protein DJ021_14175 [Phenylobacterium hankyongense]
MVLGVVAGSVIVGVTYVGWIAMALIGFATSNPCGYRLTGQQVSPDGAIKAGIVQVDCGATTGVATWAVLAPTGKAFDYRKDRVVAIEGEAIRIAWEGRKLVVSWRAPHTPNVRRSDRAQVELRPL